MWVSTWCWPFLLLTPRSNVQNFPKFLCRSGFIGCNRVRVTHRGLRVNMTQPILPDCHRRSDLVKQRRIAMPKGMEATLSDAQLLVCLLIATGPRRRVKKRRTCIAARRCWSWDDGS